MVPLSVTIGSIVFDRVRYYRDGDVLYLHVGEPETVVDCDESPEGHHTREDGVIVVTRPGRRLELRDLGDVLPVACCQK